MADIILPFTHAGVMNALAAQWRMAPSTSPQRPEQRWSMNDLSSELLALIAEQVRDIDCRAVFHLRQISQRFDAIATPIAYRTISLNEAICARNAEEVYPAAFEHMAAYTNHVEASSDLDPRGIEKVLARTRRLLSVRWRYVDAGFCAGPLSLPSKVIHSQRNLHSRPQLLVEELPLKDVKGDLHHDIYLQAIPTDLLVSLKTAVPTPPLATKLGPLKQLLLKARRLQVLHYQDRGLGTQFLFAKGERLPPFRDLKLKSYNWSHTREEVAKHWDFSRIESLELDLVPLFNFLSSVDFDQLRNLRRLHCEDYSAHLPDRRQEATRGLYVLVRHHVRALESLQMTCHTRLFPLDALAAHGGTLRALSFRDHVGFGEEARRCPTLRAEDVARLAGALGRLETLELDMDGARCEPARFLRALCAFPRLRALTLHVQTVVDPLEEAVPGEADGDYEAAMRVFALLVRGRAAAAAAARDGDKGSSPSSPPLPPPPWRSVTINVGGWRRVVVRRLSGAWRERNASGVFAERCFVLERGGGGQYGVREEMCVEQERIRSPMDVE